MGSNLFEKLPSIMHPLGELEAWQTMLDQHSELFVDMLPGSSVGFVPRSSSGIRPGKHVAGLTVAQGNVPMMVWVANGKGMTASVSNFAGVQDAGVDLLLVADAPALVTLLAGLQGDALSLIKRLIRQGGIMFFVFRTKYELQDAGYEEFLDTLGLAFLGACR